MWCPSQNNDPQMSEGMNFGVSILVRAWKAFKVSTDCADCTDLIQEEIRFRRDEQDLHENSNDTVVMFKSL